MLINAKLQFAIFSKMFHEAHMSHAIAHTGWLTLGSVHWPGERGGGLRIFMLSN